MKKLIPMLGMRFVLAAILGSCWKWAIIRSQINVGKWRGKGLCGEVVEMLLTGKQVGLRCISGCAI